MKINCVNKLNQFNKEVTMTAMLLVTTTFHRIQYFSDYKNKMCAHVNLSAPHRLVRQLPSSIDFFLALFLYNRGCITI